MTQFKGSGRQPGDRESVHILDRLSSRDGKGTVGTNRVSRAAYAWFGGRLEVKSVRPTRRMYLYRAVDSPSQTIDNLLLDKRDAAAAKRFFRKALAQP